MPTPSKRKQIAEILKQHYGNQVDTPNPKQQANYEAHKAASEYSHGFYQDWDYLVGMYAGYYVIRVARDVRTDQDARENEFVAFRLYYGIFSFTNENGTFKIPTHSSGVGGKTLEDCLNAICYQIGYNAAYRSGNLGLWQRRLPAHLQQETARNPIRTNYYTNNE